MKKIILFILTAFILSGCMNRIKFGEPPLELEEGLIIEQGVKTYINKIDKELEMRYIITKPELSKNTSRDLVFYLHGLGGSELDWVEKNGFGRSFYNTISLNPDADNYYAVSISFGRAYLFLNGLLKPYSIDLETLFINEIIPYFKEYLNCTGNVYLIGHSMGGYNCLALALRNPDIFKIAVTLSPYVGPISPFTEEFAENGRALGASELNIWIMQKVLTNTFISEERWYEYNPLKLAENTGSFPYLIFSTTDNDLPGFTDSIIDFRNKLVKNGIDHYFCEAEGDHFTVCTIVFTKFLEVIREEV